MIFDWEKEFSEKIINEGMDLEDDVSYVTTSSNYLSGIVKDGDKSYTVSIDLDDNFRIESMECECKKKKCKHMTALIFSIPYLSNRYLDFDYTIDKLDKNKLIKFIKDQVSYNDDCLDDFKDEFRQDIIKSESLSHGDELCLILDDFDWEDNLLNFLNINLKEVYDEKEYNEALFLISIMFSKVIERVAFDSNATINACYDKIVDWIVKLSEKIEDNVFEYLTDLLERHYSQLYPPFGVLMSFYGKNFNDDKYLKIKKELFNI